jgi:hypothetical protein
MNKIDKGTKKAFKGTDYGKKTFICYLIFCIIFIIAVIVDFVLYNCIDVDEDVVINFRWLVVILGVLAGYFEGQYNGALKQYSLSKK